MPKRQYKISEVAKLLELKSFVLRFWESEFKEIKPLRTPKGHRLYREQDLEILKKIKELLYSQGLTIEGARKVLAQDSLAEAPLKNAPWQPTFNENDAESDYEKQPKHQYSKEELLQLSDRIKKLYTRAEAKNVSLLDKKALAEVILELKTIKEELLAYR